MTQTVPDEAQVVLGFWFRSLTPADWFTQNDEVDHRIRSAFDVTHHRASAGELAHWRGALEGRLAEIIVLDQFSRNLYRNSAQAFANDTVALVLAQEAIAQPGFETLSEDEKAFTLMPFMHSESSVIHEQALALFDQHKLTKNLEFERQHKHIIDQFGRYPHRNTALGRTSSDEELKFLADGGQTFS